MINIGEITTGLTQVEDGMWVSPRQPRVNYPEDGHGACFDFEERSFWFRHRNAVIVQLVGTHAPRATVFDIGAGNGFVSLALQRAGVPTVVVEPGAGGVRNARARGLSLVIQATFEDAGFRSESVGAFGIFDVLEHVQDDAGFLRAMHRCLLPGGYLFVTVPACAALWSSEDEEAGHYRRYSMRSLLRILRASGFTVRYCSYFFSLLVPSVFICRSIPSRVLGAQGQMRGARAHALPGGVLGGLIEQGLGWERKRIEAGRRLPIGSSCVAVAQRG